ncbi:hypothetical protein MBLNU457_g1074t2 [Dothideomycetes sp. NU457]
MFGFGDAQDSYQQVYNDDGQPKNEGSFGHELLAGGASFAAFKAFEDHQRAEGKPVSHQFAKELLAGFAGAEVDKLAETKGMDEQSRKTNPGFARYDREKAKHQAKRNAEQMYDQHYGDYDQYDPNQYGPPQHIQDQWGGY